MTKSHSFLWRLLNRSDILIMVKARKNSSFTNEQETWIILEYGAERSYTAVRRNFRQKFRVHHREVPALSAFKRLIDRFITSNGNKRPSDAHSGRPRCPDNVVKAVKDFLDSFLARNESVSLRRVACEFGLSLSTVWRIVRQRLRLYPYKPKVVVPLSSDHRRTRREFCDWLIGRRSGFEDYVIWSDEKWFVLNQSPNRQNERYWAPQNPNVEVSCRIQGDQKVMCWAGLVNGKVIIHWIEGGRAVNGPSYVEMLKHVVLPLIQANNQRFWFQQDGATAHTAKSTRKWLAENFGDRIISRFTPHPWPARSPDLSPLDFWFWGAAMAELRRSPPATLDDLKVTVEAYANSLDEEEVRRAVRHVRTRAHECLRKRGGAFEGHM